VIGNEDYLLAEGAAYTLGAALGTWAMGSLNGQSNRIVPALLGSVAGAAAGAACPPADGSAVVVRENIPHPPIRITPTMRAGTVAQVQRTSRMRTTSSSSFVSPSHQARRPIRGGWRRETQAI